jgi:hypothetical protein
MKGKGGVKMEGLPPKSGFDASVPAARGACAVVRSQRKTMPKGRGKPLRSIAKGVCRHYGGQGLVGETAPRWPAAGT